MKAGAGFGFLISGGAAPVSSLTWKPISGLGGGGGGARSGRALKGIWRRRRHKSHRYLTISARRLRSGGDGGEFRAHRQESTDYFHPQPGGCLVGGRSGADLGEDYVGWRIFRLERSVAVAPGDAVTICDRIRASLSVGVSRSRKWAIGKRERLRLTAWFNALVATP